MVSAPVELAYGPRSVKLGLVVAPCSAPVTVRLCSVLLKTNFMQSNINLHSTQTTAQRSLVSFVGFDSYDLITSATCPDFGYKNR